MEPVVSTVQKGGDKEKSRLRMYFVVEQLILTFIKIIKKRRKDMKLFKFTVVVSAILLISAISWAGNTPEYDAVGVDKCNFYAEQTIYYQVVNQMHRSLEWNSDFNKVPGAYEEVSYYGGGNPLLMDLSERFWTNAGQLDYSPCYSCIHDRDLETLSQDGIYYNQPPLVALTDAWNQGTYEWWIGLQMKPETDLNVNIMDCVLKHNTFDLWENAEQTGRYRADWGQLFFLQASNPQITVEAYPGRYATAGFMAPITLDSRTLPGLTTVPLNGVLYTSKAHFPEGIVVALPVTGNTNGSGQVEYNLKQGDVIHVTINIPPNANTADVFYGPESVLVKYVGVVGTEFYAAAGIK
jgi:hypothetical protein